MIESFKTPPYEFLSNMHPCEIEYRGLTFTCTEAAYQAMKFDQQFWEKFVGISGPEAKKFARNLDPEGWTVPRRLKVMEDLLAIKFAFGSELAERLLDTGDEILVEGNTWRDMFWGVYRGEGLNHLGRLLMARRKVLQEMYVDL